MLSIREKNRVIHWLLCEDGLEQVCSSNLEFDTYQLPDESDMDSSLHQDSDVMF